MKSFAAEFQTVGDPKYYGNAIRLATREEAEGYAKNLFSRWTATTAWQVVESEDVVNYRWTATGLEAVTA